MAHLEQTRAVVEADEKFDGKIIPTERAELDRPVRLQDGATVQGSIYGETIDMAPNSSVEGSVMASGGVELDGSHIHGEVGTPGKVIAEDARIDGTVTGKRVTLSNCVVRGNVVGTEVILENCTVLGIATADRRLDLTDSLCYTFRGHNETVLDEVTVILPQAIADGGLTLETPVTVAGLGSLDVDTESDDEDEKHPELTQSDLYTHEGTTYLTLSPRILNLEKVNDRLEELEQGVLAAVDDSTGDTMEMSIEDVLDLLDVDANRAPLTE
ncbi:MULTISPECIES: polymer-forming cytoskeletal protein [Halolamina]|uniref:Polymer-forming protein n=2 Tax=Halolamina TaxID=1075397 RepID=A0A1I5VQ94_9EURY|nr:MULTISPECIES: polymer-forming cytoskeletal protein [Halolamina]NHX37822.1 hypothetical protein [Halolamina sp. R1-12]SFQ09724.1 hypothetical protein SAMN05216277_11931 [Halolamina pelagica]